MQLFAREAEKRSFSARKMARRVLLRLIKEFDPDDDWIEEAIELDRFDVTPDRVSRVRALVEEERQKLSDKLAERWA